MVNTKKKTEIMKKFQDKADYYGRCIEVDLKMCSTEMRVAGADQDELDLFQSDCRGYLADKYARKEIK